MCKFIIGNKGLFLLKIIWFILLKILVKLGKLLGWNFFGFLLLELFGYLWISNRFLLVLHSKSILILFLGAIFIELKRCGNKSWLASFGGILLYCSNSLLKIRCSLIGLWKGSHRFFWCKGWILILKAIYIIVRKFRNCALINLIGALLLLFILLLGSRIWCSSEGT